MHVETFVQQNNGIPLNNNLFSKQFFNECTCIRKRKKLLRQSTRVLISKVIL